MHTKTLCEDIVKLYFFFALALPEITWPDALLRLYPGIDNIWCEVDGTLPIYTALIENSTVLLNTSYYSEYGLYKEGNYTWVATNNFGADTRMFSVAYIGRLF